MKTLQNMINRRGQLLDAAYACNNAEAADIHYQVLEALYEAQAEAIAAKEHAESEAPRRAAQGRLAFHMAEDTLDLY